MIVFLSDGAANIGPTYYPTNSPYRTRPCRQGVTLRQHDQVEWDADLLDRLRPQRTRTAARTSSTPYTGADESPAITAYQAMQGIASTTCTDLPNSQCFFDKPNAGQLKSIFTAIAADLAKGTSALIDDGAS